ncbi:HNH endonuclease signature motif containing protein [Nonomuraea terrae]|uniref:HNH endonuclease signature motif containing protein n=1 Tax=Nonomuraea terrae TaxID=2530383 RepID=UPI0037B66666
MPTIPKPRPTLRERILAKVEENEAGCWIWQGARDSKGYGKIKVDGIQRGAHRVAYEALVAPITPGLVIDHLCRVTLCVNPEHLEPVTYLVNNLRGEGLPARYAERTHCDKGHEFTPENTYLCKQPRNPSRFSRRCRTCERIRDGERRRAKKALNRS